MIFEEISTLIRNNKIEESFILLQNHLKALPAIFDSIYTIQNSIYDTYKSNSLMGIEAPNDLIKVKRDLIVFARSIQTYYKTGKIPFEIVNNPELQSRGPQFINSGTINSAGVLNTGSIVAGRDVNMGVHNFYKSADYNIFVEEIQDLETLLDGATDTGKKQRYLERLRDKKKELEDFKNEIKSLAKTFSEVALNTERLKIAKSHFNKGQYMQARAVMSSNDVLDEYDQLLIKKRELESDFEKELEKTNKALFDKSNEFLILAELAIIDYTNENRYVQADVYYQKSLEAFRYEKNVSAYAGFAYSHNNFELARSLDEELIDIYKQLVRQEPEYLVYLANAYLSLSRTILLIGTLAEARKVLELAQAECENYKAGKDNLLLGVKSMVYQAMANIDIVERNYKDAAANFEKALTIEIDLQRTDNEHSEMLFVILLNKILTFYLNGQEVKKAESYLDQASQLADKILKEKKLTFDKYGPSLADLHTNFGTYYAIKKDFQTSATHFDEAIKICRKMLDINKYGYQGFLAAVLLKYVKHLPKDQVDKRKIVCEETIGIYESLPTSTESVINLSIAYIQLAKIKLFDENDVDAANLLFDKVIELRRNLSSKGDGFYKKMFLDTLMEIASIKYQLNTLDLAEKDYLEALQLCSGLAMDDPQIYGLYNGKINNSLGNIYFNTDQYDKAEIYLSQAEIIFKQLGDNGTKPDENGNPKEFYAKVLSKKGDLKIKKNEALEALKLYDRAVKVYQELVVQKPSCFYELAEVLTSMGITFERLKDSDAAKKNIGAALNI